MWKFLLLFALQLHFIGEIYLYKFRTKMFLSNRKDQGSKKGSFTFKKLIKMEAGAEIPLSRPNQLVLRKRPKLFLICKHKWTI